MMKHQWQTSKKSFRNHLDSEREEQMKWIKIEMENNVKRSLTLLKSKHSNKEVVDIIQEIQKEFQSLYTSYNNLRNELRNKINGIDEDSSSNSTQISEKSGLKDGFLTSNDEVYEIGKIVKDLKLQKEQPKSRIEHLINERGILKDKLVEKEEEILTINKNHQDFKDNNSNEITGFESKIKSLNLELEGILKDKKAFEDQAECKTNEAKQLKEANLALENRISELESLSGSKEREISSIMNQQDQENLNSSSKLEDLMGKIKNLQWEVESSSSQKLESEEQTTRENVENSARISDLTTQINTLQQEFELVNSNNVENSARIGDLTTQINTLQQELELVNSKDNQLEFDLEKKSKDVQRFSDQIKILTEKSDGQNLLENGTTKHIEDLVMKVKDLEVEVTSLSNKKIELEKQVQTTKIEADRFKTKFEETETRTSDIERNLKEKENELSILRTQFKTNVDEMSSQIIALNISMKITQNELENVLKEFESPLKMEKEKNFELTNKISEQEQNQAELEKVITNLNEEIELMKTKLAESSKSYQLAEKKIEEMAEEFFKKCEDNLRILSRRIKVSEQLHVENKELYERTKEKYENQNKDLKEKMSEYEAGLKNIKEISLTASESLSSVDSDTQRFEECAMNFLTRLSKVSSELKITKDWIIKKNKTRLQTKDEHDSIQAQPDDKKAEKLLFKEEDSKPENNKQDDELDSLQAQPDDKEAVMLVFKEEDSKSEINNKHDDEVIIQS